MTEFRKNSKLVLREWIIIDSQFIIVPRILFSDESLSQTNRCVLWLILSLTFKENYCMLIIII